MTDMFTRMTDRCRKAIVLAAEEARHDGSPRITSAHLLTGVARAAPDVFGGAVASRLLQQRNEASQPLGQRAMPFGKGAKSTLSRAAEHSSTHERNYTGVEHLLLGCLVTPDGTPRKNSAWRAFTEAGGSITQFIFFPSGSHTRRVSALHDPPEVKFVDPLPAAGSEEAPTEDDDPDPRPYPGPPLWRKQVGEIHEMLSKTGGPESEETLGLWLTKIAAFMAMVAEEAPTPEPAPQTLTIPPGCFCLAAKAIDAMEDGAESGTFTTETVTFSYDGASGEVTIQQS